MLILAVEAISYGIVQHNFYPISAHSQSNAHTFFMMKKHTPHTPIQKGDYIHFFHPQTKIWVIKKVAGIEGDKIDRKKNTIALGGRVHAFSDSKSAKCDGTRGSLS